MSSANKSHIFPHWQDSSSQAVCGGEAKSWSLYLDSLLASSAQAPRAAICQALGLCAKAPLESVFLSRTHPLHQ